MAADDGNDDAASVASSTFSRMSFMQLVHRATTVHHSSGDLDLGSNLISRGDLSRIEWMEQNATLADGMRAEREMRRQLRSESQQQHLSRGESLRQGVDFLRDQVAANVNECREDAWRVADHTRTRSSENRVRREKQQTLWEQHGRELSRGAQSARQRSRHEREQQSASRQRAASDMASELRSALEASQAKAQADKARAMAHVGNDREQRACVRESKQWAANNKYSQAEAVRVELVKDVAETRGDLWHHFCWKALLRVGPVIGHKNQHRKVAGCAHRLLARIVHRLLAVVAVGGPDKAHAEL